MPRRVLTSLAGAVALAISLAACGVPTDGKVQRIDPERVPAKLVAPSPPASAAPR